MVVGGTRTARMLLLLRLLLLSLTMMQLVAGRVLPAAAAPGMVSTASSTPTPHIELSSTAAALSADDREKEFAALQWKRGRHYQGVPPPKRNILRRKEKGATISGTIYGHRLLLGSAPPSCQGKCGSCVPCSPIHVSLGGPHGSLTQQEYYPEAWRCKCGNRFFMP